MTNLLKYLWPVLIAIYIISPFDAHPLFIDDLIAAGVLFYILYKNYGKKKYQQQYNDYYSRSRQKAETTSEVPLTLDKAYSLLGIDKNASLDKINRAYKEKMTKSHPDKVSHLSEELQEKAKELTLRLNEAYNLIKQYKK